MLRTVVEEHQQDWDSHISTLCMAYRSSEHSTTGVTPNRMMLGRELPMASHLMITTPEEKDRRDNRTKYVQELEKKIQEAHHTARTHIQGQHRQQKSQYDKRAASSQYEVGDLIWLNNPSKKIGRSPKLQTFWETDPWKVVEILSDVVVRIQKYNRRKQHVVHVDRIQKVRRPEVWALEETQPPRPEEDHQEDLPPPYDINQATGVNPVRRGRSTMNPAARSNRIRVGGGRGEPITRSNPWQVWDREEPITPYFILQPRNQGKPTTIYNIRRAVGQASSTGSQQISKGPKDVRSTSCGPRRGSVLRRTRTQRCAYTNEEINKLVIRYNGGNRDIPRRRKQLLCPGPGGKGPPSGGPSRRIPNPGTGTRRKEEGPRPAEREIDKIAKRGGRYAGRTDHPVSDQGGEGPHQRGPIGRSRRLPGRDPDYPRRGQGAGQRPSDRTVRRGQKGPAQRPGRRTWTFREEEPRKEVSPA